MLALQSWAGGAWGRPKLRFRSALPLSPLFAGFLLVCLEENRIWLLHGPEKGQVFAGGRRRWVARGQSQGVPAGLGAMGLRARLAGRGRLHFPSFLTARLSAQGSWPQPRLFSWRTKPFLFFFLFLGFGCWKRARNYLHQEIQAEEWVCQPESTWQGCFDCRSEAAVC